MNKAVDAYCTGKQLNQSAIETETFKKTKSVLQKQFSIGAKHFKRWRWEDRQKQNKQTKQTNKQNFLSDGHQASGTTITQFYFKLLTGTMLCMHMSCLYYNKFYSSL